jgi:N-terminal domain on NACHT_NTPase and P-loop NTPases
MSGLEVISGISAVATIIDSCVKVYGSARKDLKLSEELNVVARNLPIISNTLHHCELHLERNRSSIPLDVCNALTTTLGICKERAGRLQTIFETVITQEGDGWKTRYRKLLNRFGKGNAVEELMTAITEDVQLVVHNDSVRSAQPEQTQQLKTILEELQSLKPSVLDEDASYIRTQNNNTGDGNLFNVETISGGTFNWGKK